jgi:hypothetical protein
LPADQLLKLDDWLLKDEWELVLDELDDEDDPLDELELDAELSLDELELLVIAAVLLDDNEDDDELLLMLEEDDEDEDVDDEELEDEN